MTHAEFAKLSRYSRFKILCQTCRRIGAGKCIQWQICPNQMIVVTVDDANEKESP